jgi:hypothetical protein
VKSEERKYGANWEHITRLSGVGPPFQWSRRYRDLGRHIRVQAAEIFKHSGFLEGEAEPVVGIERWGTKGAIQRYNRMRDIILVFPYHCGSDRDRDGVGA